MKLNSLKLLNFRNIEKEKIYFSKNINIFYGGNGQGKTSVLEAIYLLGITKSFRVNDDRSIVKKGKYYFDVSGNFNKNHGKKFNIRIFFSGTEGKHVFYNHEKIKTFSTIIGSVPIILLSLEDLELTYGSPSFRRKFIDILISQTDSNYLQSLKKFKEIVLNRNKILSLINEKKATISNLLPWDVQFIEHGAYIYLKRRQIIKELNPYVNKYYKDIFGTSDEIEIKYQSSLNAETKMDLSEIKTAIHKKIEELKQRDINYGSTSSGPHRDDLLFFKNKQPLKIFGSQGENKIFLIGLKFAEAFLIEQHLKEKPLVLLDDIFSELDSFKIKKVIESIGSDDRQTFITTTDFEKFKDSFEKVDFFRLTDGNVSHET